MAQGKKCMFTKEQADKIRKEYKQGKMTYQQIADREGCSMSVISRIVTFSCKTQEVT